MPQILRPDGDGAISTWKNKAGGTTNLYQEIDEETADDGTTYIKNGTILSVRKYNCTLSNPANTPGRQDGGHTIRYRVKRVYTVPGGKYPKCVDFTIKLYRGVTLVASFTDSDIPDGWNTFTHDLSTAQIAIISGEYNSLGIRLSAEEWECEPGKDQPNSWVRCTWIEFEVPDEKEQIAGVSSGNSSLSGAIDGTGELAGSSAGSSSLTAAIDGDGELAGSSDGSSSLIAAIEAKGELLGLCTGSSVLSALINGAGELAGASAGASSLTGSIEGKGELLGVSAGSSTLSAILGGMGELAGISAGSTILVGILGGSGELLGVVAGSSSLAGDLGGNGELLGVCAGSSALAAALEGKGELAGIIAGSSSLSGTIAANGELAGASSGSSSLSGILAGMGILAGISTGSTVLTAVLGGNGELLGLVAGSSTLSGSLQGAGELAGLSSGGSTLTAILGGKGELLGLISGSSTLAGDLTGDGVLAGISAGSSALTAVLSGTGVLVGVCAGSTTLTGILTGIGFYLRLANAVRTAFGTQIGTPEVIPVAHDDAPFTPPGFVPWILLRYQVDNSVTNELGTGERNYRATGRILAYIHLPFEAGDAEGMRLADAMHTAFALQTISEVHYEAPSIQVLGREDLWWILLASIPFSSEGRLGTLSPQGDAMPTFQEVGDRIKTRFGTEIETGQSVAVQYDDAPPASRGDDDDWIELSILWGRSQLVELGGPTLNTHRSSGVIQARLHGLVEKGDASLMALADAIDAAFTSVQAQGVAYGVVEVEPIGEEADEWLVDVRIPFDADRQG